jgi:axial budding pattern protein 2
MICILSIWVFILGVIAVPQIVFPFNSQIPQVARVGEPYSFVLSQSTFRTDAGALQYSLTGAPGWLTIDGPNRNLTGVPSAGDVGSTRFTIVATDAAGPTTMQATLIVASSGGPRLGQDISLVLEGIGKRSGARSVVFSPTTPFVFDLPSTIFVETGTSVSYYATLADHSPLPAWINFDSSSLHFSGTTPQLDKFPQQFEISVIASDVPGFASVQTSFTIVVSSHDFHFSSFDDTQNVPVGDAVNISLRNACLLDGRPVTDSDFFFATAKTPPWLSFDSRSLNLFGMPPQSTTIEDVSIEAHDRYGDVASMILHINLGYSQLYTGNIGILNATAGEDFHYNLNRSSFSQDDFRITMDLGSASGWLRFDPNSLSLEGTIPSATPAQTLQATMTVTSKDGIFRDVQRFELRIGKSSEECEFLRSSLTSSQSLL